MNKPFIDKKNQQGLYLNVQNSQNSGTSSENILPIQYVQLLQKSQNKIILSTIAIILTGGLLGLLILWFQQLRKFFFFIEVNDILQSTHVYVKGESKNDYLIVKIDQQKTNQALYFTYKQLKYFFDSKANNFYALKCEFFEKTIDQILKANQSGLNKSQQAENEENYGRCLIHIPPLNFIIFIFIQITQPYYLLAYFSIFVWTLEGVFIASIIFLTFMLIFPVINFFQIKKSNNKIRKLVENIQQVTIYRQLNGSLQKLSTVSTELLPGDIFELQDNQSLPCDCVLLQGEVLLNEQSLTGECLPIPKFSLNNNHNNQQELLDIFNKHKRNTLLEGTKVMKLITEQSNIQKIQNLYNDDNTKVLALVIRTGFCTLKGQIFRGILHPIQKSYPFYKNALIYCLVFLVLSSLIGIPLSIFMHQNGFKNFMIFANYITILIQNLPPTIPLFINSICTISIKKFSSNNIICSDPSKIIPAAQVQVMCFDKTGTLTQQGMSVFGYVLPNSTQVISNQNLNLFDGKDSQFQKILHFQFATCHGIYLINDQLQGDLLDLSMFQFCQWEFKDIQLEIGQNKGKFLVKDKESLLQLVVLQTYEFEPELQRMGCIVQDQKNQKLYFFCKGSPEIIQKLSIQESINSQQYQETIENLGLKGLRLISFAYKELDYNQIENNNYDRNILEQNLIYSGIVAFENPLKSDTQHEIQLLQEANIKTKVISGDNPLTTVQAALISGIIQQNQDSDIILLDENHNLMIKQLNRNKSNSNVKVLDIKQNETTSIQNIIDQILQDQESQQYNFALTGDALEILQNYFLKDQKLQNEILLNQIISRCSVFARMKPIQKEQIIETYQKLGNYVGMIGDGANDCSAIKQADVGISFSTCDAGLSAPFSGENTESIKIVNYTLKQGQCCMQQIIDTCKGFIIINMIKFIANYLVTYQFSVFGDIQQIFLQIFQILPIYIIGYTSVPKKLSPIMINQNMLSFQILFQTLITQIIACTGLIFTYLYIINFEFFTPQALNPNNNGFHIEGDANSGMFLAVLISNSFVIATINTTKPFKISILKSYTFLIILTALFLYPLLITITTSLVIPGLKMFSLEKNNYFNAFTYSSFRWNIFIINLVAGLACYYSEKILVQNFIGERKRLRVELKKQKLQN